GAAINGQSGTEGRLVDLDPEQQMVSEIWALKVNLGQAGGSAGFSSDFQVASFADLWARFPTGGPNSFLAPSIRACSRRFNGPAREARGSSKSSLRTECPSG